MRDGCSGSTAVVKQGKRGWMGWSGCTAVVKQEREVGWGEEGSEKSS